MSYPFDPMHRPPPVSPVSSTHNMSNRGFPSSSHGENLHYSGSNFRGEQQDPRASYALSIQKACNNALNVVRKNSILTNSNWAAPLTAAPSAISVMAICLKTAAENEAAGLEVTDIKVKDVKGNELGTLPSTFFHTNLQHCSDIGRLAFLDAEKRMNRLRTVARSMIDEEKGSIGYIVDLLDDPEDARYNLKPEIDEVRNTARDCLANAQAISDKFEYWHQVIIHLKQTSLTKRGITVKEKEDTQLQKLDATVQEQKYEGEKAAQEKNIGLMQAQLDQAQRNVAQAKADVDRIARLPPVKEPSVWEEAEKAHRLVPNTQAPQIQRDLFDDIGNYFFGKSKEQVKEDAAYEQAHYDRIEKKRRALIAQAKEKREGERKEAEYRLREARKNERQLLEKVTTAMDNLSVSFDRLAEAKSNLAKTAADLQRLGNEELELENIMKILDESTRQLGRLKEQIEPLVLFFDSILVEVDTTLNKDLEAFLRPILNGAIVGKNPDEIEQIRLGRTSKKRILNTALQIQGRFSAISDISTAYVEISDRYIRPAINKMESLATASNSEWHAESREFMEWCDKAVTEIDEVAEAASSNMDRNMIKHISALQERAIEAAAESRRERAMN